MKGFGIYVQNDLLEPKHFKAIGQALWLYLWLLDKITSVSEEGEGKVLGGSPVKFKTVAADLPMTDRTYTRYVCALVEAGYITALRTPYGYVFTVHKAKKIFSNKENRKKYGSQRERTVNLAGENRKFGGNKEDNTVDNTNNNTGDKSPDHKNQDMSFKNMRKYKEDGHWQEPAIDLDSGEDVADEVDTKQAALKELNEKIRHNLKLIAEERGLPFGIGRDMAYHVKIYREMLEAGWTHSGIFDAFMEIINSDHWKERKRNGEYPGMNTVQFACRNKKPV